jgi:hypothetical protein
MTEAYRPALSVGSEYFWNDEGKPGLCFIVLQILKAPPRSMAQGRMIKGGQTAPFRLHRDL